MNINGKRLGHINYKNISIYAQLFRIFSTLQTSGMRFIYYRANIWCQKYLLYTRVSIILR